MNPSNSPLARRLFWISLFALSACSDDPRVSIWIDAGPRADGGDPFVDAGHDGGVVPDAGPDSGRPPEGYVRFAHLSLELGPVDVYAPGNPLALARGLAYRGATGYVALPPGDVDLELRAAGALPSDAPIATLDLTLDADQARLVALASEGEALRPIVLDEVPREPPLGFASAQVIHAMSGLGPASADLDADRTLDVEALAPRSVAQANVPVGAASSATVSDDARNALAFTWMEGIEDGSTVALALVGRVGGRGVEAPGLLAILPEASGASGTFFLGVDPEVAFVQASPHVLAAEVQVAEVPFGTLEYGDVAAPRRVPPGNAYVSVIGRDAEGGSVFAGDSGGDLVRGERYLIVVGGPTGYRDVRRFQVVTTRLALEAPGAGARAHVVHVSEDAPEPLALFVDDAAGDTAVRYGSRTPLVGVAMPTGERTLGFGTEATVPSWRFFTDVPSARLAFVVAGSYFADDPASPGALALFALDLDAWSITRVVAEPGSGAREGEEPPSPPDDPGGGIGI